MASWNHTRVDGKTEYWGASTQQGRKRQEQGYWVSRKEGRKVGRRKRDEHSENIHRIQTVTADKPPGKAKAQKWNPSYTRLWEPEGKGPTQEGLERYLVFPYPGTSLTKIKLIQTQVTKKAFHLSQHKETTRKRVKMSSLTFQQITKIHQRECCHREYWWSSG